jgi:hypothetical protein
LALSKPEEILRELAQLTMLTGRISEVHQKNMQNFPFIFFNGVTKVEIDYAIATQREDESTIRYSLELDINHNDFLDKRFKALENSVRTLFWKDVKIVVSFNGEEKFKSE